VWRQPEPAVTGFVHPGLFGRIAFLLLGIALSSRNELPRRWLRTRDDTTNGLTSRDVGYLGMSAECTIHTAAFAPGPRAYRYPESPVRPSGSPWHHDAVERGM